MGTPIENNTAELQLILNMVNDLPNAGSGGGGLPTGISALSVGTITATEDVTYLDVSHGLGVSPNFAVWVIEGSFSVSPVNNLAVYGSLVRKETKYNTTSSIVYTVGYMVHGYSSSGAIGGSASRVANNSYMTDTTVRITSGSYKFLKGYTYRWICGVLDGVN